MRLLPTIAALLLALGAVEGTAYWWMHPAPAGQGEPVLVYRPQVKAEMLKTEKLKEEAQAPAQSSSSISASTSPSPISASQHLSISASTHTPLPDIVARALPSLRCTTGTAARIDRDDGVTIHVAFFEWDLASSINVLEAFKHLPDECMGSIGMTLTAQPPTRFYQIGGAPLAQAFDAPSSIQNSKLPQRGETISFGHSILRDHDGAVVHTFKGTWVSGLHNLSPNGILSGTNQWKQLRWKAGLHRFRPAHARVAQGAVRGVPNADLAWQAFEEAILADLRME